MRSELMLAAENVIVDKRTEQVSCINVLREVRNTRYPAMLPSVALLSFWVKEDGDDDEVTLELVLRQGGQESAPEKIPVRFNGREKSHAVLNVDGLIIAEPGDLDFVFKQGDREIVSWRLTGVQVGGVPTE